MKINNTAIYGLIGVSVFIISKLILSHVGIENIPVPIIISLLVVSYTMFLIGMYNKRLTGREKNYYILCAILLAVLFITVIIIAIFLHYFSNMIMEYRVFLLILLILSIISLLGITIIGIIINKKYLN